MRTARLFAIGLLVLTLSSCSSETRAITSAEDAAHARIGVMTGTTGEVIAKTKFPQAQIKSFDDVMDAVGAIKAGQLDVTVTSFPTALQVTKKNPDLTVLSVPLTAEGSSVAVRKGNTELLAQVERILDDLKKDGTLEGMRKRWFKADLSPYEELTIPEIREGTPLRIGVSATREPMNFVDQHGRVTGHDGELARLLGARLKRPIEFSNMKFMALIPALQSGKIDMIVTGMTATEPRKKFVDFSQSYFENAQVMLVRKSGAPAGSVNAKMVSPADLKDKRIGVLQGSAHESFATKTYPQAQILQYQTTADVLLAVKTGKVDAGMSDDEPLKEILQENDTVGRLGEPVLRFPVGVGFRKESQQLLRDFNRYLAEIRKNGVYAEMEKRWMVDHAMSMPALEHPTSKGVLIVGTSDGGYPFSITKDNELIGFDIELMQRFGASQGKEVKFSNMDFGSLIAAVASSKVDMIAASIFVTEERQKRINFSDPYFEMGASMFGLKANIAAYSSGAGQAESRTFIERVEDSFRSNILAEKRYLLLLDGLKTTVLIAVLSTIFGTLLGALVCFMRLSRLALVNGLAKLYISLLRGTPVLVLLMLIFYVVFASVDISPVLVAVVAFGMNFAAYAAEIFRTGIESIDKGQTEAGIAMGFTKFQAFLYIVLPQTVRRILPVYKGEFISLVKMTSIVGYIAVQDLTKASDIIRSRTFDAFFPLVMVAVLYFLISWVLMQALEYLERRLDPKYGRKAVQA